MLMPNLVRDVLERALEALKVNTHTRETIMVTAAGKTKLPLYQRYILSKLSWRLTVATLPKTLMIEHLDNVVTRFVRQWLDLPISATLGGIILPKNQFALSIQLPSVKFIQCQTVLRNSLQYSLHDAITSLWKNMNIQCDSNKNTKHVLKMVRHEHTEKLQSQLPSQGFIITFLLNQSLTQLNSLWSSAQSSLPKNIFNFTVRYFNNTLANRTKERKINICN